MIVTIPPSLIGAVALIAAIAPVESEAAECSSPPRSWHGLIMSLGGLQSHALLGVYQSEGLNCYVGDHGTSFGPFQFHYGGGMGDIFTRQTGLNARNPNTVPAQIAFMRRWGNSHGGFSSSIWHGLRRHHHHHWRHHHHHHWRH